MKEDNKYTTMQLNQYDWEASLWSIENRDPVVGSFDAHNNWRGYDNLFFGIDNLGKKLCLDFGCGPGRNISKYYDIFKRIDGVDISLTNIVNARKWLDFNNQTFKDILLYKCNGIDLNEIPNNMYNIIISTITMQHICVYDIRYNYFKEFYRVLKKGGIISIQMGFGYSPYKNTVKYNENNYDAINTNGGCDVCIDTPSQLEKDLKEIGFKDFSYIIDTVGPGDAHANWIYFKAIK